MLCVAARVKFPSHGVKYGKSDNGGFHASFCASPGAKVSCQLGGNSAGADPICGEKASDLNPPKYSKNQ